MVKPLFQTNHGWHTRHAAVGFPASVAKECTRHSVCPASSEVCELLSVTGLQWARTSLSVPLPCGLSFGWLKTSIVDPKKTTSFGLGNLVVLRRKTTHGSARLHSFISDFFIKSLYSLSMAYTNTLRTIRFLLFDVRQFTYSVHGCWNSPPTPLTVHTWSI